MGLPWKALSEPHESITAFSKDLVDVPVCLEHGLEDLQDKLVRHIFMEQVGHRVHENPPRGSPTKGNLQAGIPQAQIEPLLEVVTRYAPEPL